MGNVLRWLEKAILIETDECISWPFCTTQDGYGSMWFKGTSYQAHRVALHLATSFDLDSPFLVLHSCDNPPCINPRHLSSGTQQKNMDQASKRKSWSRERCKSGHVVAKTGIYTYPDGHIECLECRKIRNDERRKSRCQNSSMLSLLKLRLAKILQTTTSVPGAELSVSESQTQDTLRTTVVP